MDFIHKMGCILSRDGPGQGAAQQLPQARGGAPSRATRRAAGQRSHPGLVHVHAQEADVLSALGALALQVALQLSAQLLVPAILLPRKQVRAAQQQLPGSLGQVSSALP